MKRLFIELDPWDRLDPPLPLGEYPGGTIHHDLADFIVTDQVLDGSEEMEESDRSSSDVTVSQLLEVRFVRVQVIGFQDSSKLADGD